MFPKMYPVIPQAEAQLPKKTVDDMPDDIIAHTPDTNLAALFPRMENKLEQQPEQVSPITGNKIDVVTLFETRKSLTPAQKIAIRDEIWKPPKKYSFPKTNGNKCQYKWLDSEKWLAYSPSKDAIYCLACVLMENRTQSKLTHECGLTSWRLATTKITKHFEPLKHPSVNDFNNLSLAVKNPLRSIDVTANRLVSETVERNRRMIKPIIATLICLGQNNIALRGHRDDSKYYLSEESGTSKFESINYIYKIIDKS